MTLTPALARDMPLIKEGCPQQVLRDDEVKGLQLVAGRNYKSFHYYYRNRDGVERRPKIGRFPEMSVNRARAIARDIEDRVKKGEDPSGEWKDKRNAPTVNELCDKYLNEWAPRHNSKRTQKEKKHLIDLHVRPGLGSWKVAEVTRTTADRFLENVLARKYVSGARREWDGKETAPGAANHVRTLCNHLFALARTDFGFAIQKVDGESLNPFVNTAKQYTAPRQRLAEPHELAAILALLGELEATQPAHAAAFWAMFFTGGRVGEIEHATKAQLVGNKLVLKEHKTFKAIGPKKVSIPAFVVEMVGKLSVTGDRLFGDIALKRAWDDIRSKAGCPDLQMRDARRTFASYALKSGFGLDAIGKLLGHTNIRTTGGYTWLVEEVSDTKSAMVEQIAASMLATLKPQKELERT